MRRSSFLVALLVAAGCGGESKKPDDSAPPPKSTAPAAQPKKEQPKEQPKPPEAQKPAAEPTGDEPIVIKGSKHKDSGQPSGDAARQARIDELKAKAKASEGKDNGPTYREGDQPSSDPSTSKKDKVKAQLDQIDAQIKSLQDEKAAMTHKSSHREGHYLKEDTTYDDPDRAKAIDDQIATLEQQKRDIAKKAAADDAKAGSNAPSGDAPKTDAPKTDAPK